MIKLPCLKNIVNMVPNKRNERFLSSLILNFKSVNKIEFSLVSKKQKLNDQLKSCQNVEKPNFINYITINYNTTTLSNDI